MTKVNITHIGGPTALVEFGGWRILTDPTFDAPGKRYFFGWGTTSRKVAGPAISARDIGEIDAVLVSHHHHGDNLDPSGRALLPTWGRVFTTRVGADQLGGGASGLAPWESTVLEAPGKPTITITATPCRHGPAGSEPITGPVIGFALEWAGQENGRLWMTGDTVLHKGLREVSQRLQIGTVLMHLGGVKFRYLSAGLRYTMDAQEAVELLELLDPTTVIPVHYEGWTHFRQGRSAAEQVFNKSRFAGSVHWLDPGEAKAILA
jgi:L-ascorbate metabolism protein UlaG (beta-lactamase superfamily)